MSEFNFKFECKSGTSNVLVDALSRRPDFEARHQESVSSAKEQVNSSTLASMKAYHVTRSLASDIKSAAVRTNIVACCWVILVGERLHFCHT